MKTSFIAFSAIVAKTAAFDIRPQTTTFTVLRETSLRRTEVPHRNDEIEDFYAGSLHRHDKESKSSPWGDQVFREDHGKAELYRERLHDMQLRLNRLKSDKQEFSKHQLHELEGIVTTLLRITEGLTTDDRLVMKEDKLLWDRLQEYDEEREYIWKMASRTMFLVRRNIVGVTRSLNPFREPED